MAGFGTSSQARGGRDESGAVVRRQFLQKRDDNCSQYPLGTPSFLVNPCSSGTTATRTRSSAVGTVSRDRCASGTGSNRIRSAKHAVEHTASFVRVGEQLEPGAEKAGEARTQGFGRITPA